MNERGQSGLNLSAIAPMSDLNLSTVSNQRSRHLEQIPPDSHKKFLRSGGGTTAGTANIKKN